MQLYRMHDAPDAPSRAAVPVTRDEAKNWNTPQKGHGIFLTVNDFAGARRKENLTRINAWAIDMDDGTKQEQAEKLRKSPLVPSIIVETKRGFQAYWCAKDGKAEHWNSLVLERLVPHFGSDKNARDLCRLLRAPGFLHLKNPDEPFKIRVVWKLEVTYTERQLADAFTWSPDLRAHREALDRARNEHRKATATSQDAGEDFWQAVYELNCRDALERLSGTSAVNGESFTFRRVSNGNQNIFVDGKGTSCWVDPNGRIGSMSKGGPTIYNWLLWYKTPPAEAVRVLKSIYPHLAEIDERNRQKRGAG